MNRDEIIALGHSLRPIDQKLLTPEGIGGVKRLWYQGGEPYFDLFVEIKNGDIDWLQLTLRGRSLSWSRQEQVWQTGITNELCTDDLTFYPASKTIEGDRYPDPNFVHLAQTILATRIGEPLFDRLLALFPQTSANIS